MPPVMKDKLVLWNIGTHESPNLVWWKGGVSEIEQPRIDDGLVSAALNYVKRGTFPAFQFETEFWRTEGNTKYPLHHQSESGGVQ